MSIDIISKIGHVINYDFSKELPEEFSSKINQFGNGITGNPSPSPGVKPKDPTYFWMSRYIELLKKFNERLHHRRLKKT